MPVVQLTQQFIRGHLLCPETKPRIEYCDKAVPGLYVEVRRSAPRQGTYYLRYKNPAGKTAHQRLARTSDISLSVARKRARTLKSEIALGSDPKEEAQQQPETITFETFLKEKYLPHAARHKRSYRFDLSMSKLRLIPKFGHIQLALLTRQQIQAFHTDLQDEGLAPATCDHHLKLMRHALNLAVDWELLEKNPAERIQLFHPDNRVERLLSDSELSCLLKVLRTDENRVVCLVAIFLLSTGARLNEALQAKWSQVDKTNQIWRIPASNSKSKRIRSVPLNASALSVLQNLGTEGRNDYLFVSSTTGERMTTIHKVWDRLRTKAGLPHLRLHDLRHQYASFLVNDGRTLYEVQQILGHSSPTVTQRYAHLSTKALQEAADSASLQIGAVSSEDHAEPRHHPESTQSDHL
ncbi:site-specific integrase [Marinobacterium rhizophilum]|uniref:site-specific integrase n=1 Tax=Marinobacterium rhizophilum TaxID=420402 RepID=UPI0003683805|nr:site-specific integrase [Marinobacterium rhizophilum]